MNKENMRIRITATAIFFLAMLVFAPGCQNEESPSPVQGTVTFSLSKKLQSNGREMKTATPNIIQLSVQDDRGTRQEHIRLTLYDFGQGYVSENLQLLTGTYQLLQFDVLDSLNRIIYTAPKEDSDLAEYVSDPLPIEFVVVSEGTQVVPQVVAVPDSDPSARLNIKIKYPDPVTYDSAYVVFKNSETEVKMQLTLNNSAHTATGAVTLNSFGNWKISTSYYKENSDYRTIETREVATLGVSSTSTELISDETGVYIEGQPDVERKSFVRNDYYYYKLLQNQKLEGFVRLPVDPTNPFVQISMYQSKWQYAYADRTFYNSNSSGSSNFLVGSGAFEVYNQSGDTHDGLGFDVIDSTSLVPVVSAVKDKVWNTVDCVVLIYGAEESDEIFLFHRWDLRASSSAGRVKSGSSSVNWTRAEKDKRRKINLNQ
jgi:hypothetical protein